MFEKKEIKILRRNLYHHIDVLTQRIGERNIHHYSRLVKACEYIAKNMAESSFHVEKLKYEYDNLAFHNIVAEKIGKHKPDDIIIIGAHYDTVTGSPGADDNASGIAALLEFVRLFSSYENKKTFRFVAFTLEEPPFYSTTKMGSHVYAKRCKKNSDKVVAMVSLEMLAYFNNKKNSQQYPQSQMAEVYPNKGNFIAIIGDENARHIVETLSHFLRQSITVPVESLVAHQATPGINLSDHVSFWNEGYRAIMITDTAFYRNPYYHKHEDTIDKLDFKKFSRIVHGLDNAFKLLDNELNI